VCDLREEPSAVKPHARICEGEAEWLSYSTTTLGNAMIVQATCVFELSSPSLTFEPQVEWRQNGCPPELVRSGQLRISVQRGRPFQRNVDGISDERGRRFRLIVDDVSA